MTYVNTTMKLAKAKGTVLNDRKWIEKMDVLILNEFELQPFYAQFSQYRERKTPQNTVI